ncbi:hypothetical protein V1477_020705 [Vespula maculifrons]|uniref:Uncharacterized protein n=1 Tax=Vespula maculifrons TaxID=7453 RepID=A0ABD2APS4_VESMC
MSKSYRLQVSPCERLHGNTGRIERTFARVSAGTGVVFPDAVKSPTGDFVLFVLRLFVHAGLADLKE